MGGGLFVDAKVFLGTGEDDFATAFRIDDGVFTWVGDTSDVAGEPATELGGATVLPGLLDVHSHPSMLAGLAGAVSCLPPDVDSLAGLLDRMRTHPALGRGADHWIEGFGFDESGYPEGRKPTRHDLDRVSATQAVFVRRCDSHSMVCNTRALELAGITRDTPDPRAAGSAGTAQAIPTACWSSAPPTTGCWRRAHRWAGTRRSPGWPASTPTSWSGASSPSAT